MSDLIASIPERLSPELLTAAQVRAARYLGTTPQQVLVSGPARVADGSREVRLDPADLREFDHQNVEMLFQAALKSVSLLGDASARRRLLRFLDYMAPESKTRAELEFLAIDEKRMLESFWLYDEIASLFYGIGTTYDGKRLLRRLGPVVPDFLKAWADFPQLSKLLHSLQLDRDPRKREEEMARLKETGAYGYFVSYMLAINGEYRSRLDNGGLRQVVLTPDQAVETLRALVARLRMSFPEDMASVQDVERDIDDRLTRKLFPLLPQFRGPRFRIADYEEAAKRAMEDGVDFWPVERPDWDSYAYKMWPDDHR